MQHLNLAGAACAGARHVVVRKLQNREAGMTFRASDQSECVPLSDLAVFEYKNFVSAANRGGDGCAMTKSGLRPSG